MDLLTWIFKNKKENPVYYQTGGVIEYGIFITSDKNEITKNPNNVKIIGNQNRIPKIKDKLISNIKGTENKKPMLWEFIKIKKEKDKRRLFFGEIKFLGLASQEDINKAEEFCKEDWIDGIFSPAIFID